MEQTDGGKQNETTTLISMAQSTSSASALFSSKKKNVVKFAKVATMRFTLQLRQYTKEERRDSFYAREDFETFKEETQQNARIIEETEAAEEGKAQRQARRQILQRRQDRYFNEDYNIDCRRGAEYYTNYAIRRRMDIRKKVKLAVLKEQMNQWMDHLHNEETRQDTNMGFVYDDERIATVYNAILTSHSCATNAYLIALSYEQEQQRIYAGSSVSK